MDEDSATYLADASSLYIRGTDTSLFIGTGVCSESMVTADLHSSGIHSKPPASSKMHKVRALVRKPVKAGLSKAAGAFLPSNFKFDPNTYDYTLPGQSKHFRIAERTQAAPYSKYKKEKSEGTLRNAPRPRKSSLDLQQRLCAYKAAVQAKLQEQRLAKDQEEARQCTFAPQISNKKETYRTPDEYYQESVRRETKRQSRLANLKESLKAEDKECTFTPALCKESVELAQTSLRTQGPAHERLAQFKVAPSPSNTPAFCPEISSKSKELRRKAPVDELLYEDALRRRNNAGVSKAEPQSPALSGRSQTLLAAKFLREVQQVKEKLGEGLNYTKFTLFLESLKFTKAELSPEEAVQVLSLWKILEKVGRTYQNLMVMAMGIMGYYQSWMSIGQPFTLTQQGTKAFHKKYFFLYSARTTPNKLPLSPSKPLDKTVETNSQKTTSHTEASCNSGDVTMSDFSEPASRLLLFDTLDDQTDFVNSVRCEVNGRCTLSFWLHQCTRELVISPGEVPEQKVQQFADDYHIDEALSEKVLAHTLSILNKL